MYKLLHNMFIKLVYECLNTSISLYIFPMVVMISVNKWSVIG